MIITVTTEIKYIKNAFQCLNEFGIDINLQRVLSEELKNELPSDINSSW